MILFLALGVLTGCNSDDPENSAEYKAFQEASESGDYEKALILAEAHTRKPYSRNSLTVSDIKVNKSGNIC